MKSGLRGGKPRDMATFKKGGTSRGAGAAKKGFDYQIYAKGGGVKKYAEGGATRKEYGGTESMPEWDVPQYSFSDIKKFFTGKSSAPASKVDETKAIPDEDTGKNMAMRRVADVPVMQGVEPPAPRPSAPQRREAVRRSPAQRRAMQMAVDAAQPPGGSARPIYPDVSQPPGGSARPRSDETPETESPGFRPQGPVMREGRRPLRETEVSDLDVMEASRAAAGRETPPINPRASEFRSLSPAERERRLRAMTPGQRREAMRLYGPAEVDPDSFGYRYRRTMGYAKGGKVKMAGGGSCRGMGAATRGGKYTIK
jgi:hypothetical protein